MEPIIISNPYIQKSTEFAKLYWREVLTRFWFIPVIFGGIMLANAVKGIIDGSAFGSLIPLGVFLVVIVYGRFRFLASLKRNIAFQQSRVLTVFENKLEIEADSGSKGVFSFTEIQEVKSLETDYRVRLKSKQVFWIPKSCFKSVDDLLDFERIVRPK